MAHIMTSLIGTIIEGSEKSGLGGGVGRREVKMYLCYRQKTSSVPQQGQMKNQMRG